jgi:hypothetical protein
MSWDLTMIQPYLLVCNARLYFYIDKQIHSLIIFKQIGPLVISTCTAGEASVLLQILQDLAKVWNGESCVDSHHLDSKCPVPHCHDSRKDLIQVKGDLLIDQVLLRWMKRSSVSQRLALHSITTKELTDVWSEKENDPWLSCEVFEKKYHNDPEDEDDDKKRPLEDEDTEVLIKKQKT